jgi:EAL and modified HD-GYP domain-containing signal transduction protein
VAENVGLDPDVIEGCRQLSKAGYRIALDDYSSFEGAEPLLEVADLAKIDVRRLDDAGLLERVTSCRRFDIELVAIHVETGDDVERCFAAGFDYVQGYALSRPRSVAGRTLQPSALGPMRVAASLLGDEFEVHELEDILRTEPAMTYQLFQLAGVGARDGMRRDVRTLRDALVLVGSVRVQSWVALLMLRPQEGGADDALPAALARARMCEILAHAASPSRAAQGFTAGILSSFELLLDQPASVISDALSLDEALREAAFGDQSLVARIVRDVVDHQGGKINGYRRSGLTEHAFDVASMKAIMWSEAAVWTFGTA